MIDTHSFDNFVLNIRYVVFILIFHLKLIQFTCVKVELSTSDVQKCTYLANPLVECRLYNLLALYVLF